MPDYDWPGSLGDDLAGKANAKGQPWSVTPVQKTFLGRRRHLRRSKEENYALEAAGLDWIVLDFN